MILLIGIISVIQLFPLGIQLTSDSKGITTANSLANAQIESTQEVTYENLNVGTYEEKHRLSDDDQNYLYGYQRETTITYLDQDLDESVTDIGLKKITTNVFWLSPISHSEASITISTIRSNF